MLRWADRHRRKAVFAAGFEARPSAGDGSAGASSWKRLDPWGFHPRIDIARESVSFGIEHMDVLGVNLETDGLAATYSVKSA